MVNRGLVVVAALLFAISLRADANQGGPVYTDTGTRAVAGAACYVGRVRVDDTSGQRWCCPSGTWVDCSSTDPITATGSTTARSLADRAADLTVLPRRVTSRPSPSTNPLVLSYWPLDAYGAGSAPAGLTVTRAGYSSAIVGNQVVIGGANQLIVNSVEGALVEVAGGGNILAAGSSESFANAAWSAVSGGGPVVPTVVSGALQSPSGTMTMDRVTFPAVSGAGQYSLLQQSFTAGAMPHTFSVFVRGDSGWVTLYISITDGATVSYKASITVPAGPPRRLVVTTPALTVGTWYVTIGPDARAFSGQPASQGAAVVNIWGAQVDRIDATFGSYGRAYQPAGSAIGSASLSFANPLDVNIHSDWCVVAKLTPLGGRSWSASDSYPLRMGTVAAINSWSMRAFTDGGIWFAVYDAAGAMKRVHATHGFQAGSTHEVACCNRGGVLSLYFDGVAASAPVTDGAGTGILGAHSAIVADPTTPLFSAWAIRDVIVGRTADGTKVRGVERVLAIGDSITAGSCVNSSTTNYMHVYPWPHAYGVATGRVVQNVASPGTTTANMASDWTANRRGRKEDIIAVLGGTNDVIGSIATATTLANLNTIYDAALADGQKVIAITVPPGGYTGAQEALRLALNQAIRDKVAANPTKMVLADAAAELVDPATGNTLQAAYNAGDSIHLTQAGAYAIAALVRGAMP